MKVKREWAENEELAEMVMAALEEHGEFNEMAIVSGHLDGGEYGERGVVDIHTEDGRKFRLELHELV